MDLNWELHFVLNAAKAAGVIALDYFRQPASLKVEIKKDHSPVTQVDKMVEKKIVDMLRGRVEDAGFLGEEFGEDGRQDRRWIIDPIDATKNFIKGIPTWAILIALEEEGVVTLGVVYNPATKELWWAVKGGGAFCHDGPIKVSSINSLDGALLLHANIKKLWRSKYWNRFLHLVDRSYRQRGPGDFSGYMMVAQGLGEIYLEPSGLKPHDLAAPSIIVNEAGGKFTDIEGKPTIYSGSALATNSLLHQEVLYVLQKHE